MLSSRIYLAFVFVALFTAPGCSKSGSGESSAKNPQTSGMTLGVQDQYAVLNKTALGKEFLLQVSQIGQLDDSDVQTLKSRVVLFKKHGNNLSLLESLSQNRPDRNVLLTQFPIIQESSDEITFDFNSGANNLFKASELRNNNKENQTYNRGYEYWASPLGNRYIDSIEVKKGSTLIVRQVAQLGGESLTPVILQYYLSLYTHNPSFVPRPSEGRKHFGISQTAPQLTEKLGKPVTYMAKFDLSKKIHFAISPSIPPEYREAVRDGGLYWNTIFGREIVEISDAPENIRSPDPDCNLIQWVEHESSDELFTSSLLDPRTGEVLHSDIYLPSSIPLVGAQSLRIHSQAFGVASDLPEGTLTRLIQDYVRYAVAHEMGHALGLLHNLAGSASSNFSMSQYEKFLPEYLRTGKPMEGIVFTSSVMDYFRFLDGAFVGAQVKERSSFLHDKLSIYFLYQIGELPPEKEIPPTCSEYETKEYVDCSAYDIGSSPFDYVVWKEHHALYDELPYKIIDQFVSAKEDDGAQSASLDPKEEARDVLMSKLNVVFRSLDSTGQFLTIDSIAGSHEDEAYRLKRAYLKKMAESQGGLRSILSDIPGTFPESEYKKFETLIDNKAYVAGYQLIGKKIAFSLEDIKQLKETAKSFYKKLYTYLIYTDVGAIYDISLKDMGTDDLATELRRIRTHKLEAYKSYWGY